MYLLGEIFKTKLTGKRLDLVVVIILNLLAGLYAHFTNGLFVGNILIAGLITQIFPIAYLSFRKKKNWKKILAAVLIFDLMFEPFDFIAEYTRTWTVVSNFLPKIAGVLPLENIITHQAIVLYTIIFYEHFLNDSNPTISKKIRQPLFFGVLFVIVTAIIYKINPLLFSGLNYPFLVLGTLAIIPTILIAYVRPTILTKLALSGVYFFFYYLVTEIFAGHRFWLYPGNNYIGWVTILGVTFPIEEFVFWVMLYGPTIIAYYELWADDLK